MLVQDHDEGAAIDGPKSRCAKHGASDRWL